MGVAVINHANDPSPRSLRAGIEQRASAMRAGRIDETARRSSLPIIRDRIAKRHTLSMAGDHNWQVGASAIEVGFIKGTIQILVLVKFQSKLDQLPRFFNTLAQWLIIVASPAEAAPSFP